MKKICFVIMMLVAVTASAAGLQQLIDSLKKPPVAPQPAPTPPSAPQPPKLPVKK